MPPFRSGIDTYNKHFVMNSARGFAERDVCGTCGGMRTS
jgi:hypothetical protein